MSVNQSAARRTFVQVFVTTGTSIFIQFVAFGSGIVLARGLNPTGRGELAIAMQWPLILAAASGLGVSEAVAFYSARAGGGRSRILASALLMGVFQSILAVGIGWLVLPILLAGSSSEVLRGALVYLLFIPLVPAFSYPTAVLQSAPDLRLFNLVRSLPQVGYTLLLAGFWLVGLLNVPMALLASLLATAIAVVVYLGMALRTHSLNWSPDIHQMVKILGFGWKVYLGQLAGLIGARADVVALSVSSSATVVGIYVAAVTIGAAIEVVPTSLAIVLLPTFARLEPAQVPAALARLIWVGLTFLCIASGLVLTVLPALMVLLLGEPFRAAADIAHIFGIAAALRGCSFALASVLRGFGKPLQSSVSDMIAMAVLVLVLVLFVPQYGATGAAVAVLLSALAGSVLRLAYLFRSTPLSPAMVIAVARSDLARLVSPETRAELHLLLSR